MPDQLTDADDKKLVTLARATRARVGATEGAALRDTDGRTYAAATVELASLSLTAVQSAIAMAVASGCSGLEAVVVLGEGEQVAEGDLAVVRDLAGAGVPVHRVDARGSVLATVTT